MVRAVAYLNSNKKAIGGDFKDGKFSYYIGGGVTVGSTLEIEGLDINNNVIVNRQKILIIE